MNSLVCWVVSQRERTCAPITPPQGPSNVDGHDAAARFAEALREGVSQSVERECTPELIAVARRRQGDRMNPKTSKLTALLGSASLLTMASATVHAQQVAQAQMAQAAPQEVP